MIYYFIGYFIIRKYDDKKTMLVALVLLVGYIIFYATYIDLSTFSVEKLPTDQFYYMGIFIFGIYLGSRNDKIKYDGVSDVIACLLILLAIYGHKYLMLKGLYLQFQFIQQFLMFPLEFTLLKISRSSLVTNKLMNLTILSYPINCISKSTLEIYLVHTVLARLKIYSWFDFPLNVAAFLLLTFIFVVIVRELTRRTIKIFGELTILDA